MIKPRMKSSTVLRTINLDLTDKTDIIVTLEQKNSKRNGGKTFYREYVPTILEENRLSFCVPRSDAMLLTDGESVCVQILYTDAEGMPNHTKETYIEVSRLRREEAYGPE